MEAKLDSVGRIVLPKPLRDALGLKPGATVDVSLYGNGLQVVPGSRAARIEEQDGRLVAISKSPVADRDVFRLLDESRR
jgi:AbrB family looped-hinge helix DNA binding protein